jgi:DNA-binding transcriptional LysR family regulator
MDWTEQRLGRHLKLRDLNILLTVARCGSMGKASAQLALSQPAISMAISEMEASLGVKLLDRSPRGVEPTIYARALLERGLNAFDELRQAVKHIEFLADPTAGEVRIGSSLGTAMSFVSVVIDRLARRYPRITFDLLTGDATLTYRALEERKIDLLIARIFAPVDEEHMQAEVLYDVRDVVVAAAQNPWTRRRRVKLADLVNEPWVLPPTDSLQGITVAEAFRVSGLEVPRAAVITALVPVRNALLAGGRFLTIEPDSDLQLSGSSAPLKRVAVNLPTTARPVGIITLKHRTLGPTAQLFIEAAREVARTLGKAK